MRTLVRISMDVDRSNTAITSGKLPKIIQRFLETVKPEASYFYAEHGKRTALFVFDLKNQSDIPVIAEPWFIETGASVEMFPVMNVDDLKSGLDKASSARELVGV
jgi:hypothetical protein